MDEEPFEVRYDLTLGEACRAQARLLLSSPWVWALVVLGTIGVARFVLTRARPTPPGAGFVGGATTAALDVFAITFLVLLVVGPLLVLRHGTRILRDHEARAPTTFRFDARGYEAESPGSSGRVAWTALEKATETSGVFILFLQRDLVVILPRRILSGREDRLRAWLRAALGEKAKLRKA